MAKAPAGDLFGVSKMQRDKVCQSGEMAQAVVGYLLQVKFQTFESNEPGEVTQALDRLRVGNWIPSVLSDCRLATWAKQSFVSSVFALERLKCSRSTWALRAARPCAVSLPALILQRGELVSLGAAARARDRTVSGPTMISRKAGMEMT